MNPQGPQTAVVTIAMGEKYLEGYNRHFRASQERFARSIGSPLIVITEPLSPLPKHPSWHKLLIFNHPEVARFDRVIFLDADIYVMRGARNPAELVPAGGWGASRNNPWDHPGVAAVERGICEKRGMPEDKMFILNGGFFVVQASSHRQMMEKIFLEEPDQDNWEQNPLSCALLSLPNGVVLPGYFNAVAITYRKTFGKGLLPAIRLARTCGFIHFCGGMSRGNIAVLAVVRAVDALKSL